MALLQKHTLHGAQKANLVGVVRWRVLGNVALSVLPKIESVAVRQTILGRILNFGTVTVTGTGGTKESFRAIFEPIGVRKKLNQIIERNMQSYTEYQQHAATQP